MSNGMHASELERLVGQYQTAVLRTCYLYLCDPVTGGRCCTGNFPEGLQRPGHLQG